jgi:hypothetical protein
MIAITRTNAAPLSVRAPEEKLCVPPKKPLVPDVRNRATELAENSVRKQLSRPQITALVILAKKAWTKHRVVNPDAPAFEDWRVEECRKACGARLSEAQQKDFSAIKSHFANIAGQSGKAFDSAMRSGTEKERIAHAVLKKDCAKAGVELSYASHICWAQFKCKLEDATAKQLWCLVFTVRNRPNAGRSKTQEMSAQASSLPSSVSKSSVSKPGRNYILNASAPTSAAADDNEPDPF